MPGDSRSNSATPFGNVDRIRELSTTTTGLAVRKTVFGFRVAVTVTLLRTVAPVVSFATVCASLLDAGANAARKTKADAALTHDFSVSMGIHSLKENFCLSLVEWGSTRIHQGIAGAQIWRARQAEIIRKNDGRTW
jgi:hypothetical protein